MLQWLESVSFCFAYFAFYVLFILLLWFVLPAFMLFKASLSTMEQRLA
ncbi:cell division protein FtsK [Prevotella pallens ATCC 700821]|uniref:Cell division protein FtsK n=1 Tax=Prevotella pallens ATCC 700821 TaxID=997353 RepID=F9DKG6_9BACT|nr:cell division protein FtsK [Prevotella pallens ATCC 700821]